MVTIYLPVLLSTTLFSCSSDITYHTTHPHPPPMHSLPVRSLAPVPLHSDSTMPAKREHRHKERFEDQIFKGTIRKLRILTPYKLYLLVDL